MPSPAIRRLNVVMVRMDETSAERVGSILRRLSACYTRFVRGVVRLLVVGAAK